MKNILVTGGAGFIGSAFVRHMVATYPEYNIVCFDKLTYAGNIDNLLPVSDEENYRFERGDVADRTAVQRALEQYAIDTIVNFAAESHVDRSILRSGRIHSYRCRWRLHFAGRRAQARNRALLSSID